MNSGTQELCSGAVAPRAHGDERPPHEAIADAAITARTEGFSDLLSVRFVLSEHLMLECAERGRVTVANRLTSERFQLSQSLYRFLCRFQTPRTIRQVAPVASSDRLLQQIRRLVDKRILMNADAPAAADAPRDRRAVAHRFCNSPPYGTSAASVDFVVLGVPYDLGGAQDCRSSPTTIRQKSLDYSYELQFATARPRGWLDVDVGRRILEGALIADAGDVYIRYGESQQDLYMRIGRALDEIGAAGAVVPLILGGDRTVTCAVVDHLCKRESLTVVQFAMTTMSAEADCTDPTAAPEIATRLLSTHGLRKFVHFGKADSSIRARDEKWMIVRDAAAVRTMPAEEVVRQLALDSKVHVSIDLSEARAQSATPTGAGLREGLTFRELKDLLRALGEAHRISSIDLVGLDSRGEWHAVSAVTACQIALAAMSAAYDSA